MLNKSEIEYECKCEDSLHRCPFCGEKVEFRIEDYVTGEIYFTGEAHYDPEDEDTAYGLIHNRPEESKGWCPFSGKYLCGTWDSAEEAVDEWNMICENIEDYGPEAFKESFGSIMGWKNIDEY